MGRGIFRGAGGDENLKSNFIWPKVKSFHLCLIVYYVFAITEGISFIKYVPRYIGLCRRKNE